MKLPNVKAQASFGVFVALLTAMGLLEAGNVEPTKIRIGECELNGFELGGTTDQMREALGEPDSLSMTMTPGNDYPHQEYRYEGLRIVFSMHGRSGLSFYVSSDEYRLHSGVGVGSTRQEIESALGATGKAQSGDTEYLIYLVAEEGGQTAAQLIFKLDRNIAVEFSVISR